MMRMKKAVKRIAFQSPCIYDYIFMWYVKSLTSQIQKKI